MLRDDPSSPPVPPVRGFSRTDVAVRFGPTCGSSSASGGVGVQLGFIPTLQRNGGSEAVHPLALRLLGDVANGGPLLANDGPHVLCGHQQSEGDVGVLRFGGHS